MTRDDLLPGGIDPDDLADAFERHDGNINAISREFDVCWNTAANAAEELGLHEPEPSLATKLRRQT